VSREAGGAEKEAEKTRRSKAERQRQRPFATMKDMKCLKKRKIMRTQINLDGHCLRGSMNAKKRVHHEEREGVETIQKQFFP
jgi:hypothetical protein